MSPTSMYRGRKIENTLYENFMTEYLVQAQWAEMMNLKRIINNSSIQLGRKLRVLDIGIGDARIPRRLSGIKEIWDLIAQYDGIDNSEEMLEKAQSIITQYGLDKVKLYNLDARELSQLNNPYELILCTYFTAGDFYPNNFSFKIGEDGRLKNSPNLEKNESFQQVFHSAYNLLTEGGKLVLGSIYVDNESTRRKQEEFYKKCGMIVITRADDSFTATKEGFWSQRFTEEKIRSYFDWIKPEDIEFRDLDTYDFAKMVIVLKQQS